MRVKLRDFVLKVATSGPHLIFVWTYCNNQGWIYHMAQGPIGLARSQKGTEGPPHPIEMLPMTKYDKKSIVLFSYGFF